MTKKQKNEELEQLEKGVLYLLARSAPTSYLFPEFHASIKKSLEKIRQLLKEIN
ncbi:MAG: hypothetical protein V4450_00765 [Bacteroidota bacterium]